MKINEVEALVGVTRKNIRFYEQEGLIAPSRNASNGYRDYGEADVAALRRVKLMRKLGVPLAEIRRMSEGVCTVGDGMRRHLVTLERERRNLEHAKALCERLRNDDVPLSSLDAEALLAEMDALEHTGAAFRDVQKQDVRRRWLGPVLAAVSAILLMAGLAALLVFGVLTTPGTPAALLAMLILPAACVAGVLLALVQRLGELRSGEADDAKRY